MGIFLPITIFFFFALAFKMALAKESAKRKQSFIQMLEEEQESNFTRARDIPHDALIYPNIDFLRNPEFDEYPQDINKTTVEIFEKLKSNILEKSTKTMMKVDSLLTNKGLKEQFGVANLDIIINAEENYYSYIHVLNVYGEMLIKYNMIDQSERVMEHCVYEMKSNVTKSYTILLKVYKKNNFPEKINQLEQYVNKIDTLQDEIELKGKLVNLFNSQK
ncbi:MAG: hypothetical protein FWG63_02050 [Defluviitaleaceae bacterium]|nr:hypothetical protein [Defluviitaleaceae bacterium]